VSATRTRSGRSSSNPMATVVLDVQRAIYEKAYLYFDPTTGRTSSSWVDPATCLLPQPRHRHRHSGLLLLVRRTVFNRMRRNSRRTVSTGSRGRSSRDHVSKEYRGGVFPGGPPKKTAGRRPLSRSGSAVSRRAKPGTADRVRALPPRGHRRRRGRRPRPLGPNGAGKGDPAQDLDGIWTPLVTSIGQGRDRLAARARRRLTLSEGRETVTSTRRCSGCRREKKKEKRKGEVAGSSTRSFEFSSRHRQSTNTVKPLLRRVSPSKLACAIRRAVEPDIPCS